MQKTTSQGQFQSSPFSILCTPPQAGRHGLEAMLRIHLAPLHGAPEMLAAGRGVGGFTFKGTAERWLKLNLWKQNPIFLATRGLV